MKQRKLLIVLSSCPSWLLWLAGRQWAVIKRWEAVPWPVMMMMMMMMRDDTRSQGQSDCVTPCYVSQSLLSFLQLQTAGDTSHTSRSRITLQSVTAPIVVAV